MSPPRLDDPAIDSPVNQCIRMARAIKIQIAEKELAGLSVKWENNISDLTLIDRHANTRIILLQVALLPITLIAALILLLLSALIYVEDLRKLPRRRAALTEKLRRLRASPLPLDNSVRTLRDLWFRCEINDAVPQLDLLCQWVDILYGSGRCAELKIRERVREMYRQQGEANRPYFDAEEDIHFLFVPPVDILIRELSEELPPFRVSER